MDSPGEYLTNILSSSSYAYIQYEYYEPILPSSSSREHLQQVELLLRQNGLLVHLDTYRDGLWIFRGAATIDQMIAEDSPIVDTRGHDLLVKDKGTYEPAILTRARQNTLSSLTNMSAVSFKSSPSASAERELRGASDAGLRRLQTTSTQSILIETPLSSSGVKHATSGDSSLSLSNVHETFISAALGCTVYMLCRDHGLVPLNSRTLILTTSKDWTSDTFLNITAEDHAMTLVTLDISLTSLGVMVLKVYSDTAPGLQCLANSPNATIPSDVSSGTSLWLAPGGNAAKFNGHYDEKNFPGNTPLLQLQKSTVDAHQHKSHGVTISSWQSKCLDWFLAKGLNTVSLEEGGWTFVQMLGGISPYFNCDSQGSPMLEGLSIFPWPTLLCFQTSSNAIRDSQPSCSLGVGRDPLSFAEEWFIRKDERAGTLAKRHRERQIAEATSKEQADVEARSLQTATYSPVALRRGSNAGSMYPTPPDAPHHIIGATPTFDGQVSTPGNPNHMFSQDVVATPQNTSNGPMDVDTDIWDSSGKKDRTNVSMSFHDNENDLFGDVGGDLFGDVTDADFSFFDEPDNEDVVQSSTLSISKSGVAHFLEVGSPTMAPMAAAPAGNVTKVNESIIGGPQTTDGSIRREEAKRTEMQPPRSRKNRDSKTRAKNVVKSEDVPAPSPPFNQEAIFSRLVGKSSNLLARRSSIFDKVEFDPAVVAVDKKYGARGQYDFSAELKSLDGLEIEAIPRTEYLRWRKVDSERRTPSVANIAPEGEEIDLEMVDSGPLLYILDSDMASQCSGQDDTSHTSDDRFMGLNSGVKRKSILQTKDRDDMATSSNALAVEQEQAIGTPSSITSLQLPLLDGDPADWSLKTYFTSPEPDIQSHSLSDLEYIGAAQILADQAVSSTIKIPGLAARLSKDKQPSRRQSSSIRELLHTVTKVAKLCFEDVVVCDMQFFLEIPGIPVANQGLRMPPRPVPRGAVPDSSRVSNPFLIRPPQVEVRRADSALSVLPSAVNFWENLGLGPSRGNKDVSALCVYPDAEGISDCATAFLDQMRSVYESFRLGSHERIVAKDLTDSLMPFTLDRQQNPVSLQQDNDVTLGALKETMKRLSTIISNLSVEETSIVIYFVYPNENAMLLVHICAAFQYLFNLYRKTMIEKKTKTTNELVLQLIPLDFIASPTAIIVPLPSEYALLATEVYDRCVNFSSASSVPAILLAQPLPKSIDFKMNATPSASVLQENSCLHIAYAQSIDDRWITAAWTDNIGAQQMTASYCLGRKNEPISMLFSDIANEIWETTMGIVSAKKIHWRIVITRIGVMDPSEIEFWTALHSTESEAQINLTLITVQTDPSLRLLPPSITLSPISNTAQSVITPVSTPQALQSIVSPDQSTPPSRDAGGSVATPGENTTEPDTDARLIDYTDQSWGAVLSHRLNNSNSLLEQVPALISGYLVKRGGTNLDDPPIVMEVNIIHSEVVGNPRTFHDGLLREILGYYRALGTLARVRGVVDPVRDIRPWHVAAAEKAVKALYTLM